jgi:hypothetical protein
MDLSGISAVRMWVIQTGNNSKAVCKNAHRCVTQGRMEDLPDEKNKEIKMKAKVD